MSGSNKHVRRQWWLFLIRPARACRTLFEQGRASFNLLVVFLGGIILFQLWATFFQMGDQFSIGKSMTVTLILGPLAGLLVAGFGAIFSASLGCLADPSHRPPYVYREVVPPFPLKNLLWRRIFGRKKLAEFFRKRPLNLYTRAWSLLRSGLNFLRRQLSGGKVNVGKIFSAISAFMTIFVALALLMVVELAFGDGSHFTSAGSGTAMDSVVLVLKAIVALWFFALWFPMIQEGFQLSVLRAILATTFSVVLTLTVTLLLMSMVFDLPVFGG